jgi:hypothetical protein
MPDNKIHLPKEIWVVKDPKGRPISLNEERAKHITDKRPEFIGNWDALKETIEAPSIICSDVDDSDTDIYMGFDVGRGKFSNLYLKAVVKIDISDCGSITTAYWTKTADVPSGSTIKWLSRGNKN